MFTLIRALTYATIFSGFVLIAIPMSILERSGLTRPDVIGGWHFAGILTLVAGFILTVWCVLSFVFLGKGTPFPLDPPRQLVVRGPYTVIRNPMYVGAALSMSGAAMFYGSAWLFGYVVLFLLVAQVFVILIEEPTLSETFGDAYADYCRRVGRWV
ncbi:MAG: isoprenylcysteine carboxylmethyltransferase family protein [Cyanobacteria bacterium]|nr:isoprenylcysteine carboxylmethyltransferase family protein [Cyanobacteriota bacterium]